ncbi:ATP-dependent Clp protease adapter ClpS [Sinomonas sp. ASV322]|uniref:ATP-dependent Clp protease adapter ClpS n=1 Tax=Sinomonas sp. ASV322 TaxID=3041920 RepID=UPI0027DE0C5A|nr:ATP-dependent Clp protease adapter ClpS [Sinomonas sp. ASV322]MDQ4502083.1 ATP-dependent Clp protease adapter ClpS [Sinomonas sp. ASV322]
MSLSVATEPSPGLTEQTTSATDTANVVPWSLVVWNDPVNLMSYVSYVFQTYFGYSETKAEALMMQVHTEGRSIVSRGAKETVERQAIAMHNFGLWATVERAGEYG